MTYRFVAIGIGATALLATSLPAEAVGVFYDFENQPIYTETPFTLAAGGVSATFAGPAGADPGAFGISSNFPSPTGFQYRLMNGDFLTIGSSFGASNSALTITFSVSISALTFAFALDDPAGTNNLSLTTNAAGAATAAGLLTAGFRYPEGTLSFSGLPFTTVVVRSGAIDFQVDNLQATISAVPEPANLVLITAGLSALAFVRRRTTHVTQSENILR